MLTDLYDYIYPVLVFCRHPIFIAWVIIGTIVLLGMIFKQAIKNAMNSKAADLAKHGAKVAVVKGGPAVFRFSLSFFKSFFSESARIIREVGGLIGSFMSLQGRFMVPYILNMIFGFLVFSGFVALCVMCYSQISKYEGKHPFAENFQVCVWYWFLFLVGAIALRIWFEVMILGFAIYERLVEIRDALKKQQDP